jgi:multiple sugar transport system ATP-binding protein
LTPVELRNVSKAFGNHTVCHDVNLSIGDREFVTLLGSSGCGKTTTLNMVAGLEDCTSGDILMNGERVNDLSPVQRDVAMVFQNYALYPHMTVAQNIGFTLKMRGLSRDEIRTRVARIAQSLELSALLERLPSQLSGGQQQRVAIGRALVRQPRVFLFDEPFSNLDAGLRVRMRAEVKELHQNLGVTSIFVTHDQEEAMSISDRIAVMNEGRVEQFARPRKSIRVRRHAMSQASSGVRA